MSDRSRRAKEHRALLTETLPYEVPVIFSNDRFYRTRVKGSVNQDVDTALNVFWREPVNPTIPYTYIIKKGVDGRNTMSVVHPLSQLEWARFYNDYATTLVAATALSEFTLRKPIAVAELFAGGLTVDEDSQFKTGMTHLEDEEGVETHLTSYFVYGKYNLLGRFIDSKEFVRHEKRFKSLRKLDISKCFFNIYTHTIAWAVKSKDFAKNPENRQSYSMEDRFDRIIRDANYGETAGIPVGPELSRIFAEIILQSVDRTLLMEMEKSELVHGWDYVVRRYIDDYFVFANDVKILDKIEGVIRLNLERYKLYINEGKREEVLRPFVSNISLMRRDVRSQFRSLHEAIFGPKGKGEGWSPSMGQIRSQVASFRMLLAERAVDVSAISGTLLPAARRFIKSLKDKVPKLDEEITDPGPNASTRLVALISVLELIFYICALDLRVRTAYTICQIILSVQDLEILNDNHASDLINHLIIDEIAGVIRSAGSVGAVVNGDDSVEVANLLICGAKFIGDDFINNKVIRKVIVDMASAEDITYFQYITAKFCMLRSKGKFTKELEGINKIVVDKILSNKRIVDTDTQTFLLLSDYLSAPDVSDFERRKLFNQIYSEKISLTTAAQISKRVGFVDWHGVSVVHLLERKRLRPAYSS